MEKTVRDVIAQPIGKEQVRDAAQTLDRYKRGKANLENQVKENEEWYRLRHWETLRREKKNTSPEPTSAWLFNAIAGKHADAMDNFPEPAVLPRERADENDAKVLSEILPVVLERNGFEQVYSNAWWDKLKQGTAVYGAFWDATAENGLGDIAIKQIDLLNIYWEPGCEDIQRSQNLFITELRDRKQVAAEFGADERELDGRIEAAKYNYDDQVDTSDKVVVVDWYYKKRIGSKTVLHYAKFCGETLLFASENDERYRERGWYDHGQYPVVFDVLYPCKGTPCGFGYVAIAKDPQMYIDRLGGAILESAIVSATPRYFIGSNTGVNEQQFADLGKKFIKVEGSLDDLHIKPVTAPQLSGAAITVLEQKINEMKETSANRDVSNGGSTSGATAAAAIAALQEAGNKLSRDMISASYRAYTQIGNLCIELVRQFYDEPRSFRITGIAGGAEQTYVDYSNGGIKEQRTGVDSAGQSTYRRPIFDIKMRAQKKNPFSRISQNELALQLYAAGFFNPERAQEASGALEMMDFEGKSQVTERVAQGQTLMQICTQLSEQVQQMASMLGAMNGMPNAPGGDMPATPTGASTRVPSGGVSGEIAEAQIPKTGYMERLAQRSSPDLSSAESGVSVE